MDKFIDMIQEQVVYNFCFKENYKYENKMQFIIFYYKFVAYFNSGNDIRVGVTHTLKMNQRG